MLAVSIIGFPMLAFFLLLAFNLRPALISFIGVGGIFLSCCASIACWFSLSLPHSQLLWQFLPAGIFKSPINFALMIDSLSLTMALVVTFVSTLIAIYSTEYMGEEPGFRRFFANINLFVAFMLILVLADSLWLLFIGWEGVGLASYLLIGFFYREPKAVSAAMKAFLTTRVGDVFLLFGIFFALVAFNTLDIAGIKSMAENMPQGSTLITITVLCFLLGAVGKSAQVPLQTWLADAMWGPTPVSALIHAATMVTAGVYLLVRMSFLVELSPIAQMSIMLVGLFTLIMAGVSAMVQTDMKRVLAYSTMSQIGYMFLAVGALAFQAAIFHLVTHAFFKALLFLSAGIIGHALNTYDLHAMGGLRKALPKVFWFFMIGSVCLMGLPFVGAGFFSKEWILSDVHHVAEVGSYLFYGAVLGTFLTGLYTARMLGLAFFGKLKKPVHDHAKFSMYGSVAVLALFSLFIGWLEAPFISSHMVSDFLSSSVPGLETVSEHLLWIWPTGFALLGAMLALSQLKGRSPETGLKVFLKNGLGFDWLYQNILAKPYKKLATYLEFDPLKTLYGFLGFFIEFLFGKIATLHTGKLSHYLPFMMATLVALSSVVVLSCY